MSSSIIGDRRWASSRKGMTVLGKVPKPINLPSQRLENHGLDPNVEIVPKGTLTWGSRPAAAPNAWCASTHSPSSADGSIGSPSYHNGRPSSGGSGTRPSTAGSDRCSEPVANAWASSSRPSSASGILASNQAPLAGTRPRSAETRPGSSHLSRFAEPIPDNSAPWGSASAGRRLGPTSKTSEFTLSSGDFPTLGSTKNSELHDQQAWHGSHDHPPPSGVAMTEKERLNSPRGEPAALPEKDNSIAWKVDTPPYTAGSLIVSTNSWHVDLQSNQLPPNTNMQPHHYGWHGPPRSPPDGIWCGGMPPPGQYGPGVGGPGNYLSDPFAYYFSQHAARSSSNTNSPHRPDALLGGYPHKKGDSFRAPMTSSDSYMVPTIPVIPIRPGIYPGPIPYDGCYGPPCAGFSSSSERERPVIGMAAGPGIYSQFSNQNVVRDPGKFSTYPDATMPVDEQVVEFHSHDSHGEQFRVLLKHHDEFDGNSAGKGQFGAKSLQTASNKEMNTWEEESETDGKCAELIKTAQGGVCLAAPGPSKVEGGSDCQVKKGESVSPPSDMQHIVKKSTLIEKIEGLNNKARVTDGRSEALVSSKEKRTKRIKAENSKADNSTKATQPPSASIDKAPSGSSLIGARSTIHDDQENALRKKSLGYTGDLKAALQQSATTAVSLPDVTETYPNIQAGIHIGSHVSHGRSDQHSKSRNSDSESQRTRTPGRDSSSINVTTKVDMGSEVGLKDGLAITDNPSKQGFPYDNKVREEAPPLDSAEYNAQRAKMKEIAVQRSKQLQKEEEERIREQKAKALAKLEDLNRRTLADALILKVDCASPQSNILVYRQDPPVVNVQKTDATGTASNECASNAISKINDDSVHTVGGNSVQKNDACSDKLSGAAMQTQVSGRKPEDAAVMQNIDFAINMQISSGTMQTCDSGIGNVRGLTMVQTCGPGFERPNEATYFPGAGPQTCQSAPGKIVLQESSFASEIGNEIPQKSIDLAHDSFSKQRHTGHRRKNTILMEKNLMEMPVSPSNAPGPLAPGDAAGVSAYCGDGLAHNIIEATGPSVQQKKKNSRSMRPRSRPEHGALITLSTPQVPRDGILEKPPDASKFETALPIHPTVSSPSQITEGNTGILGSREDIVPASIGWSQSASEGQVKPTGQWKPHPPRRTMRNGQARQSDKFRGSESVVWAPVKPSNKGELADIDPIAKNQDLSFKSGTDSQNSKYKRTEMEIYVPKFVAKDTSQQGNTQKPLLSIVALAEDSSNEIGSNKSTTTNDDGQLPTVLKSETAAEIKSWDTNRPGKHGRGHASWRQRSSPEGSSDAIKAFLKLADPDLLPEAGSSPSRSAAHFNDGWNDSSNTISVLPSEPDTEVKDQGMVNKGKRQAHKMQKSMGADSTVMDAKDLPSGAADKPKVRAPSIGSDALDGKSLVRNENPSQVERSRSHWKPKSNQPSLTPSQNQDNSRRDASQSSILVKESSMQVCNPPNVNDVEGKHTMQPGSSSVESRNLQQCQARKEGKPVMASSKDQSDLPGKVSSNLVEQHPGKSDPQNMHPTASLRCQGQHSVQFRKGQETGYGRYYRGHEADYGGRSSGQDGGYQNLPASGDRWRQSSHYEYQRIESHIKSHDQHQLDAHAEDNMQYINSRAAGPRYRERGQFNPRRGGHFYARNGGASVLGGEAQ